MTNSSFWTQKPSSRRCSPGPARLLQRRRSAVPRLTGGAARPYVAVPLLRRCWLRSPTTSCETASCCVGAAWGRRWWSSRGVCCRARAMTQPHRALVARGAAALQPAHLASDYGHVQSWDSGVAARSSTVRRAGQTACAAQSDVVGNAFTARGSCFGMCSVDNVRPGSSPCRLSA